MSDHTDNTFAQFSTTAHWIDLGMTVFCLSCAALAAGLTIGLVSVDRNELRLMQINGTPEQQQQALRILPLIKDHHWLLVTLFLFNAIANEALPIFLSGLVPEYLAIILAALLVLIFGEVLPSSIFSGRNQLRLAAWLSPVVKVLMLVFYIIARPIGLCLDWWLGDHMDDDVPFNAKDLYTLLSLGAAKRRQTVERQGRAKSDGSSISASLLQSSRAPSILSEPEGDTSNSYLDADAVMIAQGAIISSKRCVQSILTKQFHSVLATETITWEFLEAIGQCGFSRICIIDSTATHIPETILKNSRHKFRYFVVKEILADIKHYITDRCLVQDLPTYELYYFHPHDSILLALNQFQCGASRLGVVTSTGYPGGDVKGYFSMEDVVEAIIQEDIADEKDSKQCAAKVVSVLRSNRLMPRSVSSAGVARTLSNGATMQLGMTTSGEGDSNSEV